MPRFKKTTLKNGKRATVNTATGVMRVRNKRGRFIYKTKDGRFAAFKDFSGKPKVKVIKDKKGQTRFFDQSQGKFTTGRRFEKANIDKLRTYINWRVVNKGTVEDGSDIYRADISYKTIGGSKALDGKHSIESMSVRTGLAGNPVVKRLIAADDISDAGLRYETYFKTDPRVMGEQKFERGNIFISGRKVRKVNKLVMLDWNNPIEQKKFIKLLELR